MIDTPESCCIMPTQAKEYRMSTPKNTDVLPGKSKTDERVYVQVLYRPISGSRRKSKSRTLTIIGTSNVDQVIEAIRSTFANGGAA